ncbi:hypothetical protein KIN20_033918 [Parelaphostrongylus tenuis]|uniref:Uncharacterized protein n=1 Tax=Parelaphostrongylus tenuis TaxID=148309 RepID=A0AAD5WJB0_PARTN|nr:hypothetical protein KIN20_033918 [Parelaphostrongylus tenuis]
MLDSEGEMTGGLTHDEVSTGSSQQTIELDDTNNADYLTIAYSNKSSDSSVHSLQLVGPVDSSDKCEHYSNDGIIS